MPFLDAFEPSTSSDSSGLVISVENQDNIPFQNSVYEFQCSSCKEKCSNPEFVPLRQDIPSLLQKSDIGIMINAYFKANGKLNDDMLNQLTDMIIGHEIFLLLKTQKTSTQNPLRKVS